jgi:DNA polymerase
MICYIDFETKSEVDLSQAGQWAYSEHVSTELICAVFAWDDHVVEWLPGMPFPAVPGGALYYAHNVGFEYSIWQNRAKALYGWPSPPPVESWRDTMALANYYALPGGLGKLAPVLGLGKKDPAGDRLITKYSKLYLKTAKRFIPEHDLALFVKYCVQDVELERAVHSKLGDLPHAEQKVWEGDFMMNVRGLKIDLESVRIAKELVETRNKELSMQFRKVVGVNATQRDKVLHWLRERGIELQDMKAETIEKSANDLSLPSEIRDCLNIRNRLSKASTKKLSAMLNQTGSDGRVRFHSQYHGARTGRHAGRGVQLLNLSRGSGHDAESLMSAIRAKNLKFLDAVYGDAVSAIGGAIRHFIMAEEGKCLIEGDFASIEAVVLACLAGEEWKVTAFRERKPIYEMTAEMIYGLPQGTVTKKTHPNERQDGKTGELAWGYQGALGAWRQIDKSERHTDERVIEMCKAWRAKNPKIVQFWYTAQDMAINAVRFPGEKFTFRGLSYLKEGDFLSMELLNGKKIWYYAPELRLTMPHYHSPKTKPECANGECYCEPQPQLTYMHWRNKQWLRVPTYGGSLVENITQASARELLVHSLDQVNQEFDVILAVYDAIAVEAEDTEEEEQKLARLMGVRPPWAKNWPIFVDTWRAKRYKK